MPRSIQRTSRKYGPKEYYIQFGKEFHKQIYQEKNGRLDTTIRSSAIVKSMWK